MTLYSVHLTTFLNFVILFIGFVTYGDDDVLLQVI